MLYVFIIVLQILFSPIGGSAAVLLTLGWSLSSSSKNSVVPPVSLATPCRSLLQARGPRPRPKHLQRWYTCYIFITPPEKIQVWYLNYHVRIIFHLLLLKWSLMLGAICTVQCVSFCHLVSPSDQIKHCFFATTQIYVSIYLWNLMAYTDFLVSQEREKIWTEVLFGHSEGSQAIWLIESLKRAEDRIIEKAEISNAVSKNRRSVWMTRYCQRNINKK